MSETTSRWLRWGAILFFSGLIFWLFAVQGMEAVITRRFRPQPGLSFGDPHDLSGWPAISHGLSYVTVWIGVTSFLIWFNWYFYEKED